MPMSVIRALDREIIAKFVRPRPGVYILYASRQGPPRYVGRSDKLYERLNWWTTDKAKESWGDYNYFSFKYVKTNFEAFKAECSLFHRHFSTLDYQNHPGRDKGCDWKCPKCNIFDDKNLRLCKTYPNKKNSLREAIIKVLKTKRNITSLQEIYSGIKKFYNVSRYQNAIDERYNQPRIQIWIRSIISKLVNEGKVKRIGRGLYKIK